ncbi:hypothetical protein N7471_011941 [Penicillium samsonianum]|uniref:uncharacterized protein n=1 Tax=Penicillium samsonianum TaxID=1882272 RepID=UPI002547DA3D|nr:uncharacterized protein N7471_011941 [Penicillium samsonianum]KAJ6124624.1 hypothetical protein N7471_011941 [Penicillium samsonianum]
MAAVVATGANAQCLPLTGEEHQKPQHQLTHLGRWKTSPREPATYITGYIRAVRQFALNAQRGDGQGMAKVLEALTKINADTERLNQRIDTIEKTPKILSTNVSTSAANSAVTWRPWTGDVAV